MADLAEYTIKDAIVYLGVSDRTIRRLLKKGAFPGAVKRRNKIYIPFRDLDAYQQQDTIDISAAYDDMDRQRHDRDSQMADTDTRDDPQAIVKQDVRLLIQIDVRWFKFLYVRKTGDPSLVRDAVSGLGHLITIGWQRIRGRSRQDV